MTKQKAKYPLIPVRASRKDHSLLYRQAKENKRSLSAHCALILSNHVNPKK